jgi:hypothetical protein
VVAVVGEAGVALRPETGKFASEAERDIDSKLPAVARKAAGYFAAAFAVVGVGAFLGNAVSEAVDLQESASKVGVVFGDAAGQVEEFASTAASSMGISEAAALGATGTFGNLLRSTGLAEQASADMSTSMVGLASDLASFNNASPEETLDALRAGLLGEAEPLKRFGVNLSAAGIEAKALALGLIEEGEAMTDAQKATAAHALIMEQTALAQGDFERTSGGLANQQRILAAEFADVSGQIGTALLPYLSQIAAFILDRVIPAAQRFASWFADNLGPAIVAVGGFIRDDLVPAISSVVTWMQENSTWLTIVAGVIAAVFIPHLIALAAQATITKITTAAMWLASKVGAISAAVVHSAQIAWMIARWIGLAAAAAFNAARVVASWVLMGIQAVVQAAIVVAQWTMAAIRVGISLAAMALQFVVQGAVMAAQAAMTAARVVGAWVLMATQSLIQAARMAAAWFIALGPVGWIIAIVIGLVALIIANWETVKNFTIAAFNAIVSFVVGAWNGLVSAISTAISTVIDFVVKLPGRILTAIGDFGRLLFDKGKQLMQGLVDGISAAASFVGNVARNIVNAVIGFVNDNIIDGINDLLEFTIMGITINPPDIPHIPRLHSGGIFDTDGGEGLALLRNQERVITPEQRVIADQLLADLLSGTLTAGTAAQAATGGGITIEEHIHQQPGEPVASVAARVTQNVVWQLNGGISRTVGGRAVTV